MALRRAVFLFMLVLTSFQAAFGEGSRGCRATAPRPSPAAEEMPCHQAQATDSSAVARVAAPDCCAGHQVCGACNAAGFTTARERAHDRPPARTAKLTDGAPAEVVRDGRTLDHIPL
jgi:hypothetical protein